MSIFPFSYFFHTKSSANNSTPSRCSPAYLPELKNLLKRQISSPSHLNSYVFSLQISSSLPLKEGPSLERIKSYARKIIYQDPLFISESIIRIQKGSIEEERLRQACAESTDLLTFIDQIEIGAQVEFDLETLYAHLDISEFECKRCVQIAYRLLTAILSDTTTFEEELSYLLKGANTKRVHLLFHLLDIFKLEKIQSKYFEPFNEKFPSLFPQSIPPNIKQIKSITIFEPQLINECQELESLNMKEGKFILNLNELETLPSKKLKELSFPKSQDFTNFSFHRLKALKILDLEFTSSIHPTVLSSFSKTLEEIIFPKMQSFDGFNLSSFSSLKKVNFGTQNTVPKSTFNSLTRTIVHISIGCFSSEQFCFSQFLSLEELHLWGTHFEMSSLKTIRNKSLIKSLTLPDFFDKGQTDLSSFTLLKSLHLNIPKQNLRNFFWERLPRKIEELKITSKSQISGVNFSYLSFLKKIELNCLISAKTFNSFSKSLVQDLTFHPDQNTSYFDLSGLPHLKLLETTLKKLPRLTPQQLKDLSQNSKLWMETEGLKWMDHALHDITIDMLPESLFDTAVEFINLPLDSIDRLCLMSQSHSWKWMHQSCSSYRDFLQTTNSLASQNLLTKTLLNKEVRSDFGDLIVEIGAEVMVPRLAKIIKKTWHCYTWNQTYRKTNENLVLLLQAIYYITMTMAYVLPNDILHKDTKFYARKGYLVTESLPIIYQLKVLSDVLQLFPNERKKIHVIASNPLVMLWIFLMTLQTAFILNEAYSQNSY